MVAMKIINSEEAEQLRKQLYNMGCKEERNSKELTIKDSNDNIVCKIETKENNLELNVFDTKIIIWSKNYTPINWGNSRIKKREFLKLLKRNDIEIKATVMLISGEYFLVPIDNIMNIKQVIASIEVCSDEEKIKELNEKGIFAAFENSVLYIGPVIL